MDLILRRTKMLGIVFLILLAAGVYLSYGAFTKKFSSYETVTLETSTIGLQLPLRADIKLRGILVGEVLDYRPTADGAVVDLGIFPDKIDLISSDVTGSIVPKTLFGEKYVALVPPDQPGGDDLQAGDTIEKTQVSTEVEAVLNDLYPLLTTVRPEQINMTLTALATALEGRGEQIGESIEILDGYLKKLNPRIPELIEDLRLTGDVSDVYSEILPEVATILDNTVTTTTTLEEREAKVRKLFGDITAFADVTGDFLNDNEQRLYRFNELTAAQLRVFSRYAPEFPCLTQGIVNAGARQAEAFRDFTLHIVLEPLPNQPRAYNVDDRPRAVDDRGYSCLNLPNPPWSQENPVTRLPNFDDGVDEPTGKGTSRVAPGYAGTPEETALYRELLAPGLGETPDRVGDLGAVLMAPMARGARVRMR